MNKNKFPPTNEFNFQTMAVEQGAAFHDECIRALKYAGFEIVCTKVRLRDVGIEIDAITNNQLGVPMAWEFKGSWQGTRPGLQRTDTVKKAIASALLFSRSEYGLFMLPLLVMTSHIPTNGDGAAMLQKTIGHEILSVVDSRDGKKLKWLANATIEQLQALLL